MTQYLNISLKTYKQFVELSKNMAEDFLKAYNLYDKDDSVLVEKHSNQDELIITPVNETGMVADADSERFINLEELYKTVLMSVAESVIGTLNDFNAENALQEDWSDFFGEMSGFTKAEYADRLHKAEEDFQSKAEIIVRDTEVLSDIYGFPKKEEDRVWSLTGNYLDFLTKKTVGFVHEVNTELTGFQITSVYSDKKVIKYDIDVDAETIYKKALNENISDESILEFVIDEVHSQIKNALKSFSAKKEYDKLVKKDSELIEYYIKAEQQFKNYSEMML